MSMRLDFFAKLKYKSSTIILSVGIKYSVRDTLYSSNVGGVAQWSENFP